MVFASLYKALSYSWILVDSGGFRASFSVSCRFSHSNVFWLFFGKFG